MSAACLRGTLLTFACAAAGSLVLSGCAGAGRVRLDMPSAPVSPAGFTALYRVVYRNGEALRKIRLAVAHEVPDRLRLEILDPLGSSRALLVVADHRALLADPAHRGFCSFDSGREALASLTGLSLDPVLLAALLMGRVSGAEGLACHPVGPSGSEGLACLGAAGESVVRSRTGDEVTFLFPGAAPVDIRLERSSSPSSPPRRLSLRQRDGSVGADLEVREFAFQPPPRDRFSILPPEGFRALARCAGIIDLAGPEE